MTSPIQTSSRNPVGGGGSGGDEIWGRLRDQIAMEFLTPRFAGIRIVLGVSGGADSVAMLRLFSEIWKRSPTTDPASLIVAHYNHGLRGEESDGDQQFVIDLAASLGLTCHSGTAADADFDRRPGGEQAFRKARYRFLESKALSLGARYVMVAHTAEDNIETVLHNLFRGTGTAGLAGIAKNRSLGSDIVLVRPLLDLHRDQLRLGLDEIGQAWREDSSNQDPRYQRNWTRNQLLPLIRNRYGCADQAILRMIRNQSQIQRSLKNKANDWIDQNVHISDREVIVQRSGVELPLMASIVNQLWVAMGWPRQDLTDQQLRGLHNCITHVSDGSFTMPADVQVIVRKQAITLRQERRKRG